jgi:SAM-dependent methyltransferase
VSSSAYWQGLYASGEDGWDLGAPAPPLRAWLDVGDRLGPRVAVPGCGRGHDLRLLAGRGHETWGFDFADAPVAAARALAAREGVAVTVEARDVFTLGDAYAGFFDGVWEYTCFCAIDPSRREEYAEVLAAILRPGGLLLACFFPLRDGDGGPPFPVSPAESAERRHGLERLVLARRA